MYILNLFRNQSTYKYSVNTFLYSHKRQKKSIYAPGAFRAYSPQLSHRNTVSYRLSQKFGLSEVNTIQRHGVVTIGTRRPFSKQSTSNTSLW